ALTEELLRQVREDEPQPPRQLVPQIPRPLEDICLKAMAKRVQDRFSTAGDFAEALRQLLASTESVLRRVAEQPTITLPAAPAVSGPPPIHDPERRQLTVLLCQSELF